MELMTLKPLLASKLNVSGFSPMHLALQNNHIKLVRGFVALDSSLVRIKGRGRITPLHHVAQTALHIAVENQQLKAFKVLLGWLKRANRKEILDWKDEDGNTIFHIAASINQTEVMKLLHRTVNVKAKNLDGKTAMGILQTHQSPCFPEARRLLHSVNDLQILFLHTSTDEDSKPRKVSLVETCASLTSPEKSSDVATVKVVEATVPAPTLPCHEAPHEVSSAKQWQVCKTPLQNPVVNPSEKSYKSTLHQSDSNDLTPVHKLPQTESLAKQIASDDNFGAKAEELFLLQKTHITWIQGGDCNSAYYHRLISTRWSVNYIHYLLDDHKNRVEGQAEVQNICIDYFSNLLAEEQTILLYD
ncbi:hypothetical protein DY000_02015237 [Brassica cretica]|uniref:Uncharacterized protein n=2 Tax=Brassica TaxID=3705 RepID=A0ABQ7CVZ8_BRACR|nr:hypothetical protein DY000_02015237 [Brassica cretica]